MKNTHTPGAYKPVSSLPRHSARAMRKPSAFDVNVPLVSNSDPPGGDASIGMIRLSQLCGTKGILSRGVAEFTGTLFLVYIGVGTAAVPGASKLEIAFAFGMAVLVVAYATGHKSGGHINCAVTIALMIGDSSFGLLEGCVYMICQLAGSYSGAALVRLTMLGNADVEAGCFGNNGVATGYTGVGAFAGEFVCTFLLLYVVLHVAVHKQGKIQTGSAAALSIGMAVFCAHCVLIPVTGCSINPTRTIGTLIASMGMDLDKTCNHQDGDIWIILLAPLAAALVAGLLWRYVWSRDQDECVEL